MNKIDLHMHTAASDGSQTPAELLCQLRSLGIHTFSVTDHDTVDGALEMEGLVPPGMRYLMGIEFSCISPKGKCHILGYGYDPDAPALRAALAQGRQLRLQKLQVRLELLETLFGIRLTEEELQWLSIQKSPGKPHIAQLLCRRGLSDSVDGAIKTYLNPCKTAPLLLDAATAVRAILRSGGVPVWAHPLGGEGERHLTEAAFRDQLQYLMASGIRGLECHYARYTPREASWLEAQAEAHGLLISGGSDYHGTNKANLHPGKLASDDSDVPPERLTLLTHLP